MGGTSRLPDIRLVEFGAARQVAGSKLGLGIGTDSYLIDCGSSYSKEGREKLPFNSNGINALILTHAHADHMGMVPDLVQDGFRGQIYSTPVTAEISEQQISQTLSFAEYDARKNKKKNRNGKDSATQEQFNRYEGITLEDIMELFELDGKTGRWGIPYETRTEVGENLDITFYEAGHIPGAAQIIYDIEVAGKNRKLLSAFDLGRTDYKVSEFPVTNTPFVKFPYSDFEHDIDYIIAEATYGARTHRPIDESISQLERCLHKAYESRSKLIIPAFSIMRTQMLLYYLFRLDEQGRTPNMPIYFTSPSAAEINRIMLRNYTDFDEQAIEAFKDKHYNPFHFGKLTYINSADENREVLDMKGPMAVISASGMCDFGRVVGHLERSIENPDNIILLTGYQNPGTRGWQISQKIDDPSLEPEIMFDNSKKKLRAEVHRMHGMSGHADGHEMTAHITKIMPPENPPRRIFIKHGESEQCEGLKELLVSAGYKEKIITVMEKKQVYALD